MTDLLMSGDKTSSESLITERNLARLRLQLSNDAFFGTFAAVRAKRIGSYRRHSRQQRFLMGEPGEVTRGERGLQLDDSSEFVTLGTSCRRRRAMVSAEEKQRVRKSAAVAVTFLSIRLWHVSPRRLARLGNAWRPGRIHEVPALRGRCGGPGCRST